jgi:proline iminopeptidase
MSEATLPDLYPATAPYRHGFLPEKDGHAVYFEESGQASGVPVVFLHGGPGSGCGPRHRQLCHPTHVRAVLFDQRGCGRSQAKRPLQANTTADLIDDIERLREHLQIDRWLVVGGSWGGGLGLAYASAHPGRCTGAVIRGVFLSRPTDLHWFFEDAQQCMPDAWAALTRHLQVNGSTVMAQLIQRVSHGHDEEALTAALAWQAWENALTNRRFQDLPLTQPSASEAFTLLAKYRLQSHYLQHHCFFPKEGLLSQLGPLHAMPVTLLHGRLDWICRPESAWSVHQQLPHSQLRMIDNAGHNPFEAPMTAALVQEINALVESIRTQG